MMTLTFIMILQNEIINLILGQFDSDVFRIIEWKNMVYYNAIKKNN